MNCLRVNERVTIYQGDALRMLRGLPSLSVDAVITDPPYSTGGGSLVSVSKSNEKYQSSGTAKAYPEILGDGKSQRALASWCAEWMGECLRVAKEGAAFLCFSDWRQLPTLSDALQWAGWNWRGIEVWHKPGGRPQGGEFRYDSEFILYARKGRAINTDRRVFLDGMFSLPVDSAGKCHVTGKPVRLLEKLMQIAPAGGVVLDPFLGGGTTALAAMNTGRACIGCELSEEYAKISALRLVDGDADVLSALKKGGAMPSDVTGSLPTHPRTLLRRGIAKLLENAGFGPERVFQNREEPWLAAEFPALCVYITEENAVESDVNPAPEEREAVVVVQVLEDGGGLDLDDRLDALSLVVEQAVQFEALEEGLKAEGLPLTDLEYSGTVLGVADDGHRQVGVAEISFSAWYQMPELPARIDRFITGHADWDLAGGEGHPDGVLEAQDTVTLPQD